MKNKFHMAIISMFLYLLFPSGALSDQVFLKNNHSNGSISITSWKKLRDARVVKQDLDFSCGAASIATLLTEYYKHPITEQKVLELLTKVTGKKGKASFSDMKKMLPLLGFKAIGLATSWQQLLELKIPVLVYVKQRKQDHFSILSGINNNYVKLSDPSLGNRILTRGQFKKIWNTRNHNSLEGKILAIIPIGQEGNSNVDNSFFSEAKPSSIPKELLLLHR